MRRSYLFSMLSGCIAFAVRSYQSFRDSILFLFEWLFSTPTKRIEQSILYVKLRSQVRSLFARRIYKEQDFIFT
jgi:hypothetical protein